jgi:tetratricopeptide (TPR) repeat protein
VSDAPRPSETFPQGSPARGRALLFGALVFVATFLAFLPALRAEWVLWDDDRNFTENYAWRGLSAEHLRWMWTTFHMGPYQPLTWMSLALDHALFGMNPRAYHATNLVLHALAASALYFAARSLFAIVLPKAEAWHRDATAALAALFFGVHPLRAESVCWITERRDVLSGVLFASALVAWFAYVNPGSRAPKRAYWLSVALFALSLLAKATGMMLPIALLILDVWPLKRIGAGAWKRVLFEKLPFFALSAVIGVVALHGQSIHGDTLKGFSTLGLDARLALCANSLVFYASKTVWPSGLLPMYELRDEPGIEPRLIASIVIAVALTAGLLVFRRRVPAVLAAWLAFAALVAPVSGLAQAGRQMAADRYSYLPCLPFALLFGASLLWLALRYRKLASLWLAGGAMAALVLALSSVRQSRIWTNSEQLWSWTLERDPGNTTALQNLGSAYLLRGAFSADPSERAVSLARAREIFERQTLQSSNPQFWVNLGLVTLLQASGDDAARRDACERALQEIETGLAMGRAGGLENSSWRMHHGVVLLQLGRIDEAVAELEAFVAAEPQTLQGRRMLSLAYSAVGKPAEAIDQLIHALEMEPDEATLWSRMAALQVGIGDVEAVRVSYERVVEIKVAALGSTAAEGDPLVKEARAWLDSPENVRR